MNKRVPKHLHTFRKQIIKTTLRQVSIQSGMMVWILFPHLPGFRAGATPSPPSSLCPSSCASGSASSSLRFFLASCGCRGVSVGLSAILRDQEPGGCAWNPTAMSEQEAEESVWAGSHAREEPTQNATEESARQNSRICVREHKKIK